MTMTMTMTMIMMVIAMVISKSLQLYVVFLNPFSTWLASGGANIITSLDAEFHLTG